MSKLEQIKKHLQQFKQLQNKLSPQQLLKQLNQYILNVDLADNNYYFLIEMLSNAMYFSNVFHECSLEGRVAGVKGANKNDHRFALFNQKDKKIINSTHDIYFYYSRNGKLGKIRTGNVLSIIDDVLSHLAQVKN